MVCDSDPEAAVTVTIEVTGGTEVTTDAPLAQPLSRLRPATLTARSKSICKRRRFFQPMQHSATASVEPGSAESGSTGPDLR